MRKREDLLGKRFGRLLVVERAEKPYYWICLCDCGRETAVVGAKLKNGHTKSCGCLRKDVLNNCRTKHNGKHTRLYRIWCAMKDRCYGSGKSKVKNYGGRGITVCEKWRNDFSAFRDWAIEAGYNDELTIDRIDNDKGYSPDNCRWATNAEQSNNKRNNHIVIYNGSTMTMAQLAREAKINYSTLRSRINRDGLCAEDAIRR